MNRRTDLVARLSARGLLVITGFTLAACAAPAQPRPVAASTPPPAAAVPPAVVRAAPTRPSHLWPVTRLQNTDYVSVNDLAAHFGLKTAWAKPELVRTLAESGRVRFKFEANQRDCYLDGVRVFLGAQVLLHRGDLWVSRLDVIKTIGPLLRPGDYQVFLPYAPPRLIVLDAGHGGSDPGKQNLRLKLNEKDMTLDVVLRLKKVLELRGYAVQLTRSDDSRLAQDQRTDLERRANTANVAGADLFLCIHFNAVEPRDAARVMGTETYALTPQFQRSSTDNSGDALTAVAFPGNRQDTANVVLGYHLHRALLAGLKTSDRGYKRARYAVLRFVQCPAGYIEAAYLSNDTEAAKVATPEFRQQIAEAIAEGVQAYSTTLAGLRQAAPPAK